MSIEVKMKILVSSLLMIVAAIHFLPVSGVLGADSLTKLYGITISDSNTGLLLRHRAVLFSIVGLLLLLSVFRSNYQPVAIWIGLISIVSFLLLTWSIEGLTPEIIRVVKIDWIALVLLFVAGAINIFI